LRRALVPGGVVVLNCGHDVSLILAGTSRGCSYAGATSSSSSGRSGAPTSSSSHRSWRTGA
jgi:hypothetical protein